jgi:hypothetical protein
MELDKALTKDEIYKEIVKITGYKATLEIGLDLPLGAKDYYRYQDKIKDYQTKIDRLWTTYYTQKGR